MTRRPRSLILHVTPEGGPAIDGPPGAAPCTMNEALTMIDVLRPDGFRMWVKSGSHTIPAASPGEIEGISR